MKETKPSDSSLQALLWAMDMRTSSPGVKLTLIHIAQTMLGGSGDHLDGIVRVDLTEIAENTDQTVEQASRSVKCLRTLGLLSTRYVYDPRDGSEGYGNRDFLVTSLIPNRSEFNVAEGVTP